MVGATMNQPQFSSRRAAADSFSLFFKKIPSSHVQSDVTYSSAISCIRARELSMLVPL